MYWQLLTRKDVLGIVAAVALLAVVFLAYVNYPGYGQPANWGFGPDWQCTNPGEGPVCVKRQSGKVDDPTAIVRAVRPN
jgi:hypothetical protein